jgi:hypothetical protein
MTTSSSESLFNQDFMLNILSMLLFGVPALLPSKIDADILSRPELLAICGVILTTIFAVIVRRLCRRPATLGAQARAADLDAARAAKLAQQAQEERKRAEQEAEKLASAARSAQANAEAKVQKAEEARRFEAERKEKARKLNAAAELEAQVQHADNMKQLEVKKLMLADELLSRHHARKTQRLEQVKLEIAVIAARPADASDE